MRHIIKKIVRQFQLCFWKETEKSLCHCIVLLHSALKLEKSAISKVQKHIFYHFKNGKKSIFCTSKKFKTTKNAILNFFLVQKLISCHFWNYEKCVFVLLKLHFFPILEHFARLFCIFTNFWQIWWFFNCSSISPPELWTNSSTWKYTVL